MADTPDAMAAVQALRDRGAQRSDPVRWRYIETLAARTARAQGPLRTLLQRRLAGALHAYEQQAAQAATVPAPGASRPADVATPRGGPLAALVRELDARSAGTQAPGGLHTQAPPAELKALQRARGTWARLRMDRQIHRALANVPQNPGPLNSQLLVLRALQRLQALSPAYLERFIVHAEALAWLEQAQRPAATVPAPRARPPAKARGGPEGGAPR